MPPSLALIPQYSLLVHFGLLHIRAVRWKSFSPKTFVLAAINITDSDASSAVLQVNYGSRQVTACSDESFVLIYPASSEGKVYTECQYDLAFGNGNISRKGRAILCSHIPVPETRCFYVEAAVAKSNGSLLEERGEERHMQPEMAEK
ncbi:Hypothetical predicted protein [Podarcis lilfordi]|uniref:Uncharacterized protein n=1 Tax=Podarcis lilfordi TaxID=74358 RepID=A0AA35KAB6_9SAUR|nr:Hypothetical predicted protein [Podarcis lilfordi]